MSGADDWTTCWCCGQRLKAKNAVRLKSLHDVPLLSTAVVGKTYPDYRPARANETKNVRTFGPICARQFQWRGRLCTEAVPRSSMAFSSVDDVRRR